MARPNKFKYYMDIAKQVATRSHDDETKVGMILVKRDSGAIIATGYNGFVRGANDAVLPTKRPDKYPYMLHAEDNIICHCAKHGISTQDCFAVCPISPCAACARRLWQCGIDEVIIEAFHPTFNDVKLMKDLEVTITNIRVDDYGVGIDKHYYHRLRISPRMPVVEITDNRGAG